MGQLTTAHSSISSTSQWYLHSNHSNSSQYLQHLSTTLAPTVRDYSFQDIFCVHQWPQYLVHKQFLASTPPTAVTSYQPSPEFFSIPIQSSEHSGIFYAQQSSLADIIFFLHTQLTFLCKSAVPDFSWACLEASLTSLTVLDFFRACLSTQFIIFKHQLV